MPAHLIAEEGPLIGLILNLEEQDTWVLGRDPDQADFVLDDTTVSRKHVEIQKKDDGFYILNLSKVNPTLLNEEEASSLSLLKEGDRVRVGQNVFLFSEEELPSSEAIAPSDEGTAFDTIFGELEEAPPENIEQVPQKPKEEPADIYDTIFEDSSEDIPFQFSDSPYLLKVISGPNTGAEIGIDKNKTYLMGKDPNTCDIVFQDLSVSRNHARLIVDDEGNLSIEDLNSKNKTRINGLTVEERQPISSEDVISCGTTTFLVIDRSKAQETIYSPAFTPAFEEQLEEKPTEEPADIEKLPVNWKEQIIPTKYLALIGSVAAVFLLVFLSLFSLFKSEKVELAQKNPDKKIKQAAEKFPDIHFSFNPANGKLFLTGHILTPVRHQELLYNLQALDFVTSVEDNVIIDEYIWKNINDVLVENAGWRGINVYAPEAGHFVINGYLQTTAQEEALSDYLNTHFPHLDQLENRVYVEESLSLQVQSLLFAQGFDGVELGLNNGILTLSGSFDEKQQRNYESLVEDLTEVPGIRSVQNFAIAATEESARIDLTQNYQVTGYASLENENYSVVVNGKIFILGDSIDGMAITSIQPSAILLERDGLKYKIDYNR